MGLYNFKARFVPMVESGEKTHTIREKRKYPSKAGETLHLYTGLRTKQARRIFSATCLKTEPIEIRRRVNMRADVEQVVLYDVIIGDQKLAGDEIEAFARRDGFTDFADMMAFWRKEKRRFPWRGDVIHWDFRRRIG